MREVPESLAPSIQSNTSTGSGVESDCALAVLKNAGETLRPRRGKPLVTALLPFIISSALHGSIMCNVGSKTQLALLLPYAKMTRLG